MALTEEQITAQNFKSFYNQIRPYLNGSFPTPIANKFSKGDLYSTDEKIVGQWIDGKPLYQKTVDCGALPNATEKTVNHGILNIDKITLILGIGLFSNGTSMPLPLVYNSNEVTFTTKIAVNKTQIVMSNNADRSGVNGYVTIQYTKTTDSPISIGDGNDYSTDEQVVGTWIDGKPIYQKTISCGALPNATTKTVAHNITNLKRVIHLDGYGYRASDGNSQSLPYPSIANYFVSVNVVGGNIELYAQGDRSSFEESYITLQYTKTTD